ncbi:MAG: winged helix-turn-helix transcriptional regulator [Candidatus Bathyarchaeota archaeon]|nr:winged helix-turn-helix transcriptional regulator [Candidatus Bathyarchaeota archaeon]
MKEREWKLISELMKDSRRSDRELARAIGISQPTVSRMVKKLEKEKYIKEYTMIPYFHKLGYEILAITLFKYKQSFNAEKIEKARKILNESFKKGPFEIIMAERGMGLGHNALMISIHKDYTSFIELKNWAKQFTYLGLVETESFLINLADKVHYRPLTFATLAKHILTLKEKK